MADFRRLATLQPDRAAIWLDLGNACAAAGELVDAIDCYRAALRLDPHFAPAWHDLGNFLFRLHDLGSAIVCYRNAVQHLPSDPLCAYSLGRALNLVGSHREALVHLARSCESDPSRADAWINLGNAHQHLGHSAEALRCFDLAVPLSDQPAQAQMNRAVVLLDEERFSEGWLAYEDRWKLPSFASARTRFSSRPQWRGESLQGKRIILYGEQGYGDMIQFVRFAGQIVDRGADVFLEVPDRLRELFAGLLTPGHVLARGEALPPFDLHCPLMSLPLALGLEPDAIPNQPYLRVPAEQSQRARRALAAAAGATGSRLRVGFSWRGNPAHPWDRIRSLAPAQFAPLAGLPGVQWVLLQQDARPEELAALSPGFAPVLLPQQLDGFLATAALIQELDLVISVDTVTGHLTGALGRPLWLILPAFYDWRWPSGRQDSPWYPSARLFRQSEPGDWTGVVERIAVQLAELVHSPPASGSPPLAQEPVNTSG
jgi:tetratricopeptide (TPR) repeat protein